MRIAQVGPLVESVPPQLYGGTERVVHYLTEELVRQGHDVTLYASGDSLTSASLRPMCAKALRLEGECHNQGVYHLLMLEKVFQEAKQYDIIHFHVDILQFPMARRIPVPQVTTLHGRLDSKVLLAVYREFNEMPVISISNAQRSPLPMANWQGTVYNGLPEFLFRFHSEPGKYLAFLGRISPEKGIEKAIEIAKRAGMELRIAAKIDSTDLEYFQEKVKPLLNHPLIKFMGELGESEKGDFLGNAHALLFPIDWPEPFGLVMIEAFACGTPVIAFPHGSVPEIMRNGLTGFVVNNIADAVAAVNRVSMLNRSRCRKVFEQKFTARRMAAGYLDIYQNLVYLGQPQPLAAN